MARQDMHAAKPTRRPARPKTHPSQTTPSEVAVSRAGKVKAILAAAARSGLLQDKGASRISARVSPALVAQAKAATGISADTELLEFALANVAVEDGFLEAFEAAGGTVDSELKLGY